MNKLPIAPISLVIPVYNRAELVGRTLDSVAAQSVLPAELVIVDNDSSDDSARVISQWIEEHRKLPVEVKFIAEKSRGAANARNAGLNICTQPWVMFFDSDDVMRGDMVKRVYETLSRHPDADIVCWNTTLHLGRKASSMVLKMRGGNGRNLLFAHIHHAVLATQRFAVRRSLLVHAGGWPGNLHSWDDWELGIRLLLHNPVVCQINESLADVYLQPQSITGTDWSSRATANVEAMRAAIDYCKSKADPNLGDEIISHILLKGAVLAGNCRREGSGDLADRIMEFLYNYAPTRKLRILLKLTASWTRFGIRGAETLFSKLIPVCLTR